MAALAIRIRRAVAIPSSIINGRPFSSISSSSSAAPSISSSSKPHIASPPLLRNPNPNIPFQSRAQSLSFHSSPPLSIRRDGGGGEEPQIGPDDILFEGCDYNHWLITMDFPKDPKPTNEEMVETYVQTLAKVVGSVEEAKKRMYACSTTTYHGFQAVMTEETSEKFRGLPGVVFILPDSYIDPVNKQYGGDKYDNGVITPRPPPIQYNQRTRRSYNERPRYDGPMQQGNPRQDRQPFVQGDGRNYAPQQSYPRQPNSAPPAQDGRGYNAPVANNFGPPGERRNYAPPAQDGRVYDAPINYNIGPSGEMRWQAERRDYPQAAGGGYNPQGRDGYQGEHRQQRNAAPQEHGNFSRGQGGDGYLGSSGTGNHRQGWGPSNTGEYRQGSVSSYAGDNRQRSDLGYSADRQSSGPGYGQNYSGSSEGRNES